MNLAQPSFSARRLPVPHVIDIQIHIVHPQVLQAFVDHAFDVHLPGNAVFNFVPGAGQEFRGHYHLIPFGKVPQGPAGKLLTGTVLIRDGSVIEIDAQFQSVPDDLPGMLLIQRPGMLSLAGIAKAHAPHADAGNVQVGLSKPGILHGVSSFFMRPPVFFRHSCFFHPGRGQR